MNQQPQPRLFKVKEGKLPQWLTWCEQLSTSLQDEARATIRDEGASHEFSIIFELAGVHYVMGCMLTDAGLEPRPSDSSQAINQEHRRMRQECLEYVGKVDYGYFLKAAA
jgi:Family of unknown function (DUF6176)